MGKVLGGEDFDSMKYTFFSSAKYSVSLMTVCTKVVMRLLKVFITEERLRFTTVL